MYRPSTSRKMCVYPPPQEKERGKRKKKSSALPTPFLPLRPLLQPPAAPSHSSYEPRAGRSEYNFLYCVNVRTIRLNKKKNVYITKRRRLDHCVYHPPGETNMEVDLRDPGELGDFLEFQLNNYGDRAPRFRVRLRVKIKSQEVKVHGADNSLLSVYSSFNSPTFQIYLITTAFNV